MFRIAPLTIGNFSIGQGDTGIEAGEGIDTRYKRARELVVSSSVEPSYRALMSALRLSQGTTRRFLEAMTSEGVLRRDRDGRRYVLASRA